MTLSHFHYTERKKFPPAEKGGLLCGATAPRALKQGPPGAARTAPPQQSRAPGQRGQDSVTSSNAHSSTRASNSCFSIFVCTFLRGAIKRAGKSLSKSTCQGESQALRWPPPVSPGRVPARLTGSSGPPKAGTPGKRQGMRCSSRAPSWLYPSPFRTTPAPAKSTVPPHCCLTSNCCTTTAQLLRASRVADPGPLRDLSVSTQRTRVDELAAESPPRAEAAGLHAGRHPSVMAARPLKCLCSWNFCGSASYPGLRPCSATPLPSKDGQGD